MEDVILYYTNLYKNLQGILTDDIEENDGIIEDFIIQHNLPDTFYEDMQDLETAVMNEDEDTQNEILTMYNQLYHTTQKETTQKETTTTEVDEPQYKTTAEVATAVKEKNRGESISYESITDFYMKYKELTGASDAQMDYEVVQVIQHKGAKIRPNILKSLLNTQSIETLPKTKKFLSQHIKSQNSARRGNGEDEQNQPLTEKELPAVLGVMAKVFTFIVWTRMEEVVKKGSALKEEHLATLPIDKESYFVTEYAQTVNNGGAEHSLIDKILISIEFLEQNTDILIKERQKANAIEQRELVNKTYNEIEDKFKEKYGQEDIMHAIEGICEAVIEKYRNFLPNLFINKPKGILTKDGVLYFDTTDNRLKLEVKDLAASKLLYEEISSTWTLNGSPCLSLASENYTNFEFDTDIIDANGNGIKTYLPNFLLMVSQGMYRDSDGTIKKVNTYSTYEKKLEDMLYTYLYTVFMKGLESTQLDPSTFILNAKAGVLSAFLNAIICEDFDSRNLVSLIYIVNYNNFEGKSRLVDVNKKLTDFMQGTMQATNGKVIYTDTASSVGRFLYAMSYSNYVGDTLFSYEAMEKRKKAGKKAKISEVLVGRGMSGSDVTLNFEDNTKRFFSIMAGSRSGKGVQTLNILISLLGMGTSIVYADSKPDMAGIFWDLERKYNVPILSIDDNNSSTASGQQPVRQPKYGQGVPESVMKLGFVENDFYVIGYMKLVVLMAGISDMYGSSSKPNMTIKGEEPSYVKLFVYDEINKVVLKAHALLKKIKDKKEKIPTGNKQTPEDKEAYDYLENLWNFLLMEIKSAFADVNTTSGGISGVKTLIIGQNVAKNVHYYGNDNTTKNPFYYVLTEAGTSIIGVRHGNNEDLGISSKSSISESAGLSFLGMKEGGNNDNEAPSPNEETGFFALLEGGAKNKKGKVYKSYLTLNANDIEAAYNGLTPRYEADRLTKEENFTGSLLRRVKNVSRVYQKDLIVVENGVVKPNHLIGFIPLMEQVLMDTYGDAKKSEEVFKHALTSLYTASYNLIRYAGYEFANVEDFLFDCSQETLIGLTGLQSRAGLHRIMSQAQAKTYPFEPLTQQEVADIVYGRKTYKFIQSSADNDNSALESNFAFEEPTLDAPMNLYTDNTFAEEPITYTEDNYTIPEDTTYSSDKTDTYQDVIEDEDPFTYEDKPYTNPIQNEDVFEKPSNQPEPMMQRVETTIPRQTPPTTVDFMDTEVKETIREAEDIIKYRAEERLNEQKTQQHYQQPISNVIEVDMSTRNNPFARGTKVNGAIGVTKALTESSLLILGEIEKAVGALERVQDLTVSERGILVNGLQIRLKYSQEVLANYPRDIALRIQSGNYIDLFYLRHIYKMPNLMRLTIEAPHGSDEQVLRDLKIKTNPQNIVNKLPSLNTFYLNGVDMFHQETQTMEESYTQPASMREKMASFFGINQGVENSARSYIPTEKIMKSNTLRSIGKGTLQAGAVWGLFNVAVPVFGVFGLLAGAFALGNYYTNRNKNK